jgi:hypothetical protein
MANQMNDFELIKDLELELVRPETRKNVNRLDQLICDEFEEFSSSGRVFDKQDILDYLPKTETPVYYLNAFRFKAIYDGCILVKYITQVEGKRAHRSSIWVKVNGYWKILHHQSSVIPGAT